MSRNIYSRFYGKFPKKTDQMRLLKEGRFKYNRTSEEVVNVFFGAAIREAAKTDDRIAPLFGALVGLGRESSHLLDRRSEYLDVSLTHHGVVLP